MTRTRASPRKVCRVCVLVSNERDLVEGGLLAGWSPRSIAERFTKLTRKDITRHAGCVARKQASGKEE